MTILVALKDHENNQVIIGTDSQITYGQIISKTENKYILKEITVVDEYNAPVKTVTCAIMCCGYSFMKNFIEYGFNAPSMSEDYVFIEYLQKDFLPKLSKLLIDNHLSEKDNGQLDSRSRLIIIFDGEIYAVGTNNSVIRVSGDYTCEGSGYEVALGSLHTQLNVFPTMNKVKMVKNAVKAACDLTTYCSGDINIECIHF